MYSLEESKKISDEREKQKQEQKQEIEKIKKALNTVFNLEEGKILLNYLFKRSGYFQEIVNYSMDEQQSIDNSRINYWLGRRSMINEIIQILDKNLLIKILEYGSSNK